eukprot:TRINITY_DN844_c0_g1_i9.p1 TRINITY_DN844_c0_g1~~TRINITY_DN844_c0_g1_i9.p1  ORF type:complete len:1161 (-),score=397.96 TRINITY_DN844_c0_g1_i9:416-3898(-)
MNKKKLDLNSGFMKNLGGIIGGMPPSMRPKTTPSNNLNNVIASPSSSIKLKDLDTNQMEAQKSKISIKPSNRKRPTRKTFNNRENDREIKKQVTKGPIKPNIKKGFGMKKAVKKEVMKKQPIEEDKPSIIVHDEKNTLVDSTTFDQKDILSDSTDVKKNDNGQDLIYFESKIQSESNVASTELKIEKPSLFNDPVDILFAPKTQENNKTPLHDTIKKESGDKKEDTMRDLLSLLGVPLVEGSGVNRYDENPVSSILPSGIDEVQEKPKEEVKTVAIDVEKTDSPSEEIESTFENKDSTDKVSSGTVSFSETKPVTKDSNNLFKDLDNVSFESPKRSMTLSTTKSTSLKETNKPEVPSKPSISSIKKSPITKTAIKKTVVKQSALKIVGEIKSDHPIISLSPSTESKSIGSPVNQQEKLKEEVKRIDFEVEKTDSPSEEIKSTFENKDSTDKVSSGTVSFSETKPVTKDSNNLFKDLDNVSFDFDSPKPFSPNTKSTSPKEDLLFIEEITSEKKEEIKKQSVGKTDIDLFLDKKDPKEKVLVSKDLINFDFESNIPSHSEKKDNKLIGVLFNEPVDILFSPKTQENKITPLDNKTSSETNFTEEIPFREEFFEEKKDDPMRDLLAVPLVSAPKVNLHDEKTFSSPPHHKTDKEQKPKERSLTISEISDVVSTNQNKSESQASITKGVVKNAVKRPATLYIPKPENDLINNSKPISKTPSLVNKEGEKPETGNVFGKFSLKPIKIVEKTTSSPSSEPFFKPPLKQAKKNVSPLNQPKENISPINQPKDNSNKHRSLTTISPQEQNKPYRQSLFVGSTIKMDNSDEILLSTPPERPKENDNKPEIPPRTFYGIKKSPITKNVVKKTPIKHSIKKVGEIKNDNVSPQTESNSPMSLEKPKEEVQFVTISDDISDKTRSNTVLINQNKSVSQGNITKGVVKNAVKRPATLYIPKPENDLINNSKPISKTPSLINKEGEKPETGNVFGKFSLKPIKIVEKTTSSPSLDPVSFKPSLKQATKNVSPLKPPKENISPINQPKESSNKHRSLTVAPKVVKNSFVPPKKNIPETNTGKITLRPIKSNVTVEKINHPNLNVSDPLLDVKKENSSKPPLSVSSNSEPPKRNFKRPSTVSFPKQNPSPSVSDKNDKENFIAKRRELFENINQK